ncbi:MAG: hypothetical protein PVJ39_04685 [Gammaproteobacteria bacterium]|jgi:hypothetical protein
MSDKIYVGSAKIVPTKYGDITKVTINLGKLKSAAEAGNSFEYDGEEYIKLDVVSRREPSHGKTHSVSVDTWRPEQGSGDQKNESWPADRNDPASPQFEDDVPF